MESRLSPATLLRRRVGVGVGVVSVRCGGTLAGALAVIVFFGSAAAAGVPGPPPDRPGALATVGGPWEWPVTTRELLRGFEAPSSRYAAGHRGIDIVAVAGQEVRSPADGVVFFAGTVVDRPVLSIQHDDDLLSSFEPVRAVVAAGDPVRAGQVVGVVAMGAHCSARCVHFGVRRHGLYVSPMAFLGGIDRAVLLPFTTVAPAEPPGRG